MLVFALSARISVVVVELSETDCSAISSVLYASRDHSIFRFLSGIIWSCINSHASADPKLVMTAD